MDKIPTVLIGKGYWGSKLRTYIENNKHFDLKSVCDSKSNLNDVWADESVQAVVIATPNSTHFELAFEALFSGKHVMVEKPLALTGEECGCLQKLASEKRRVLLTEYTYTFSESLRRAVDIVNRGDIGSLMALDMSVKHLGRFGGGSVYWLLGSHMLSVLDMFHPLEELVFERKDIIKYDGEVESGVITFEGDIRGQISLSLNHPWKESQVTIYCEDGSIKYNPIDPIALRTVAYERADWTVGDKLLAWSKECSIDEKHNLKYAIDEFYHCINGDREDNSSRAVEITKILCDLHSRHRKKEAI